MYKVIFKTPNGEITQEYNYPPVNYSDCGELYYRENEECVWTVATPPARYRARQDCYEKFGKDKFLNQGNVTAKEQHEMKEYFNKQVEIYEKEEKSK